MAKLIQSIYGLLCIVFVAGKFDLDGSKLAAVARIHRAGNPKDVMGHVNFWLSNDRPPKIVVNESLFDAGHGGDHGIHIHTLGDLVTNTDCSASLGHYNPTNMPHGGPEAQFRHIGDLGNYVVMLSREGTSGGMRRRFPTTSVPLRGPHSIIGRMLVIHADRDDFGKEGHVDSKTTGNAGARVGCGVIGIARDFRVDENEVPDDKQSSGIRKSVALLSAANQGSVEGHVTFEQAGPGQDVRIYGSMSGVDPVGQDHGFHIHTMGNLTDDCMAATSHWNPEKKDHGDRNDKVRHIGDLGNLKVDASGKVNFDFTVTESQVPLVGPNSIVGRMVVLHSGQDDLGAGTNAESVKTGNAGKRLACGVIGIASDFSPAGTFEENSTVDFQRLSISLLLICLTMLFIR